MHGWSKEMGQSLIYRYDWDPTFYHILLSLTVNSCKDEFVGNIHVVHSIGPSKI